MMPARARNLLVFAAFLCVVALAVGSQSKILDLAIVFASLGLYLIGSVIVVVKWLTGKPEEREWRLGWGGCLPRCWVRWLLGETNGAEPRKSVQH